MQYATCCSFIVNRTDRLYSCLFVSGERWCMISRTCRGEIPSSNPQFRMWIVETTSFKLFKVDTVSHSDVSIPAPVISVFCVFDTCLFQDGWQVWGFRAATWVIYWKYSSAGHHCWRFSTARTECIKSETVSYSYQPTWQPAVMLIGTRSKRRQLKRRHIIWSKSKLRQQRI